MIKILLLAVVPFMTQHRNVAPKTVVSTNFYGSVTGIVNSAYIKSHGDGIDTNAVRNIVNEQLATNGIRSVDGAARPLPKYLHVYEANDSYTNEAAAYYRSRGDGKTDGGCSAVRSGGYLYRNFDFPFDDRAEFVVRMSASTKRFASVGVAQVGTNLTEAIVTSGKPSRWYKALPGATVDGINENGVVAEINVVDGAPPRRLGGDIHPLAAVRWALDNGTSAEMVATSLAARIQFPADWTQNYHWMIADETSTYIVENGEAHAVTNGVPVMTNFRLYPTRDTSGAGQERYNLLADGEPITNAWFTRAYSPTANWRSEFKSIEEQNAATNGWARLGTMEARRATGLFWQSVHTSIYDLTNRVLRVAVQETDDWYTFQVPSSGGTDEAKVREIAADVASGKLDGPTVAPTNTNEAAGKAADAQKTGIALTNRYTKAETDAKLAGKANKNGDESENFSAYQLLIGGVQQGMNGNGEYEFATTTIRTPLDSLSAKANRPIDFDSSHAGNLASLTADGDLEDSGIAKTNVATKTDLAGYLPLSGGDLSGGVYAQQAIVSATIIAAPTVDAGADIRLGSETYYLYNEDECLADDNGKFAHESMISAADQTFSNAVMGVASHTNADFAAEVLAVQVASLSTNITAEVYIAATNACANLGIDPALIPGEGTIGTVGGFIAMLFAVVYWMKRKIFDNSGKVNDDFATDLLGKQVAISAVQDIVNDMFDNGETEEF